MKNIKGEIIIFRMLMVVWFLSLFLSAVMFTISLMNEVVESLFISGLTGVFSTIGIFYTGSTIIKIKSRLEYIKTKKNISVREV